MARALIITFKDFHDVYDGGSQANRRNYEMARKVLGDGNVDCYFVNDAKKRRGILSLFYAVLLFPFGYFNGLTPRKVREIIGMSPDYDYVFVNTCIFGIISKKLKEKGYKGRIINFFHNVESIYYESRVPKYLPFRNVITGCAARNEEYSLKYADTTVGLCKRDSDILQRLYSRSFDFLAPISFTDKCKDRFFDEDVLTGIKPKCYFIGSNFPANAEGILWFVRNVLPHVDIDFKVVGRDMDTLKQKNECLKDVEVHSTVPDLAPYFEDADFMVFPIFDGSGMKVKTCEALMYGKNILGTTETFEGYDLDPNLCGCLCNTAEEYIEAIKDFCEHPIPRYNQYSRNIFVEKYSEENSIRIFKEVFQQ